MDLGAQVPLDDPRPFSLAAGEGVVRNEPCRVRNEHVEFAETLDDGMHRPGYGFAVEEMGAEGEPSAASRHGESGRPFGNLGLEVVRRNSSAFGGEPSDEGFAGQVADGGDEGDAVLEAVSHGRESTRRAAC